jgi:hypothetical protein
MDAAGTNTKPRMARYFMAVPSVQEATAMLLDVSANRRARRLLTCYFSHFLAAVSAQAKRWTCGIRRYGIYGSILQLEPSA